MVLQSKEINIVCHEKYINGLKKSYTFSSNNKGAHWITKLAKDNKCINDEYFRTAL